MRAKLEQVLGLAEPPECLDGETDVYWEKEPILAPRHLKSRRSFASSADWLERHANLGYHRWTQTLFRGAQIIGFGLLVALGALAYFAYTGSLTLHPS